MFQVFSADRFILVIPEEKLLFSSSLSALIKTPKKSTREKRIGKQTANDSDMFQFHFFFCPFFVTRLQVFSPVCWFFWTLCVCSTFVLRSFVKIPACFLRQPLFRHVAYVLAVPTRSWFLIRGTRR